MKWLRRAGCAVLALAALAIPATWWLLAETHRAPPARHAINLAELRRLADAQPGEKPAILRVETIAHLAAPATFVAAGTGLQQVNLPVSAFALAWRDHLAIVDTAFDPATARGMTATGFDRAAYARLGRALAHASLILVTHEHPDHIAGLLAQPDRKQLLAAARLTREQVAVVQANRTTDAFAALHLPADLFAGIRPLDYAGAMAIAPGVVLLKAPGHTPGSQMVYVRRADGAEFLFTGDVAWHMRNITEQREKARLVAWLSEEDRAPVREELAALAALHAAHPEVHMIPGHDGAAITALVRQGLLVRGF